MCSVRSVETKNNGESQKLKMLFLIPSCSSGFGRWSGRWKLRCKDARLIMCTGGRRVRHEEASSRAELQDTQTGPARSQFGTVVTSSHSSHGFGKKH